MLFSIESQDEKSVVQSLTSTIHNGTLLYGHLLSMSLIIIIVLQPISTHLLKMKRSSEIFLAGSALICLAFVLVYMGVGYLGWYGVFAVYSVSEVILSPKLQWIISNVPKKGLRNTYFSIINTSGNVAFFWPWIGGILYERMGMSKLFISMSITAILAGLVLMVASNKLTNRLRADMVLQDSEISPT